MHLFRVGAVVIDHALRRYSLAEIRLKAVNAHIQQHLQLILEPLVSRRIREIYDRHAGLPHIPLPYLTVCPSDEIALLHALVKDRGLLSDVAVNPDTDVQSLRLDPPEQTRRIGENTAVPDEIAPVELLHPEAVKMEGTKRNASVEHTVNKTHDRRLVVVRRKRGGKPETKGPRRRKGRLACQIGVACQHLLHGRPVDKEVIQIATLHGKLGSCNHLRGNLNGDLLRMVYENAVSLVRDEERNIFIGLFGAGSAVRVPDIDTLSVLHKGRKSLARSVYQLSDRQGQHLTHIGLLRVRLIIGEAPEIRLHQRKVTPCAPCNHLTVAVVGHRPVLLRDDERQRTACDADLVLSVLHVERQLLLQLQLKGRCAYNLSLIVIDAHSQNLRRGRSNLQCEIHASERISPCHDMCRRSTDCDLLLLDSGEINLCGCETAAAFLLQPTSIAEFHTFFSLPFLKKPYFARATS